MDSFAAALEAYIQGLHDIQVTRYAQCSSSRLLSINLTQHPCLVTSSFIIAYDHCTLSTSHIVLGLAYDLSCQC